MKKLEDKVLQTVFLYETKKTMLSALIKLLSVASLIGATTIVGSILIQSLIYQETLSVFEIFQQDVQALHTYVFDTVYVVVTEMPKGQFVLTVLGCMSLCITGVMLYKNFRRMRNKIVSLMKYWLTGKKT